LVQMETFEAAHTMAWNSDLGRWTTCGYQNSWLAETGIRHTAPVYTRRNPEVSQLICSRISFILACLRSGGFHSAPHFGYLRLFSSFECVRLVVYKPGEALLNAADSWAM